MSDSTANSSPAAAPTSLEEPEPTYVSDELYEAVVRETRDARERLGVEDAALRSRAEAFCYREARLLDDRRLREWAELFEPDCLYWVPANPGGGDPRNEIAIALSDRRRLLDRVAHLETGSAWCQEPPSRTCRMISNVEVWQGDDGDLRVRSNFVIWEYRFGDMQSLPGWQHYRLATDREHWRIKWKVVNLLQSDGGIPNIAFIV
jgi:3-phenylpropionate/cinnamic acid dioxygenase small subunit